MLMKYFNIIFCKGKVLCCLFLFWTQNARQSTLPKKCVFDSQCKWEVWRLSIVCFSTTRGPKQTFPRSFTVILHNTKRAIQQFKTTIQIKFIQQITSFCDHRCSNVWKGLRSVSQTCIHLFYLDKLNE